ncbi:hypothetical protein MTO96_048779 [Rhipicephalus appendiculatus]
MEVQVEGEEITREEFCGDADWCTIGSKYRSGPSASSVSPKERVYSRAVEGDGRQRVGRPRNIKQQLLKASRMPALPRNDFKIVVRPKGGLNIAAIGAVRIASAVYRDAGVSEQDASEDIVCPNNQQNIVVISTPISTNAEKYRKLEAIRIGDRQYEVNAYETAPDHTVKGVIRGIPLEEDTRTINTKIVNAKNRTALAAKRLSNTTTVIIAFESPKVSTLVRYGGTLLRCSLYRKQVDICHQCGRLGHRMDVCPNPTDKMCRGCGAKNRDPNHQCTPKCRLCGGEHLTADKFCRAKFKTPYIVKKRRWERKRAEAEAELQAVKEPGGELPPTQHKSRSLSRGRGRSSSTTTTGAPCSRQQSRSRSRGRSRTPGPGRVGSRSSRRHQSTQEDPAIPESVSWADKVKGAPKRGVSGETASEPRVTNAIENEVIAEMKRENAMLRSLVQQLTLEVRELRKVATPAQTPRPTPVSTPAPSSNGEDQDAATPPAKKRAVQSQEPSRAEQARSEIKAMLTELQSAVGNLSLALSGLTTRVAKLEECAMRAPTLSLSPEPNAASNSINHVPIPDAPTIDAGPSVAPHSQQLPI